MQDQGVCWPWHFPGSLAVRAVEDFTPFVVLIVRELPARPALTRTHPEVQYSSVAVKRSVTSTVIIYATCRSVSCAALAQPDYPLLIASFIGTQGVYSAELSGTLPKRGKQ